jgi:RND superfamily putative drug exporter
LSADPSSTTTPSSPSRLAARVLVARWRWIVPALFLVAWLAVGGMLGSYSGKLSQVQRNDASAFLPTSSESTKVSDLQKKFTSQEAFPAFVLVESSDRLGPQQLAAVGSFAQRIPSIEVAVDGAAPVTVGDFLVPGPVPVIGSQDGKAALLLVNFKAADITATLADGKSPVQRSVEEIRSADDQFGSAGMTAYVAGPAGLIADFVTAFGGIEGVLLYVALGAVLIILLLVYRSPFVPLVVLFSVGFAYSLAGGLVYFLASGDVITLDGQSNGILSILVIGAATDYGLLLVSRYREELRRHDDRYEAMWLAWRRAVEPVAASAATVILGLLCLLISNLGSTKGLGPVGAIGVAAALLAALTFLPAALLFPGPVVSVIGMGIAAIVGAVAAGAAGALAGVGATFVAAVVVGVLVAVRHRRRRATAEGAHELGRWLFWPAVPHVGSVGPETKGLWAEVSRFVGRRARLAWVAPAVVLLGFAAFLPTFKAEGVATTDVFLTTVESVTGGEALGRHFPGGSGSPTVVVGPADELDALVSTVRSTPGVAAVVPATDGPVGPTTDGPVGPAPGGPVPGGSAESKPKVVDGLVELQVTLADAADSPAAYDTVRRLRTALDAVGPDALVGGTTAQDLDVQDIATRDRNVIIPIILAVIFVVLALLLRALVAPLILLAANVLSFAATLGASALVFNQVLGFPGSDPTTTLYGFVFLVALGIDYSIFLMTRVREESIRQGTRPGILAGLAVTGGVITSAGIVLAATFAALGVIPLIFLAQIGFIVAFGVLLDTFVVRSLLVPALAYELGRRTWLPSRLGRREGPPEQGREGPKAGSESGPEPGPAEPVAGVDPVPARS